MRYRFTILMAVLMGILFYSERAYAQVIISSSGTDTVITAAHIQKAKQMLRDNKREGKRNNGELSTGTRLLGGLAKSLLLNTIDSRNPNFEYDPVKYPLQGINPGDYQDYQRRLNLLDPLSYRYYKVHRSGLVDTTVNLDHRANIFQKQ